MPGTALNTSTGVVYILGQVSGAFAASGNITSGGVFYAADGTSSLPAYSFTSEATLGFWRSAAATVTLQGVLNTTGNINAAGSIAAGAAVFMGFTGRAFMGSPSNGNLTINNNAVTIGSLLKVDALPTVSSGFGTSPAVIAGSTALAGSINVGTGGVATTGVILFNGTAFPSTPFIVVTCSAGAVPTIAVATTTQITFTTSTAWPASTIVNWHAISARV